MLHSRELRQNLAVELHDLVVLVKNELQDVLERADVFHVQCEHESVVEYGFHVAHSQLSVLVFVLYARQLRAFRFFKHTVAFAHV